MKATIVIGVGNEYRGDDAIGLLVARRLKELPVPHTQIIEAGGEGAALMEAWKEAETVILIDAVQSGASAGTIHRLDAQAQQIPQRFFRYSTHAFSVAEAIELARALNQLPARLLLYGIEGKDFAAGAELSTEVRYAAEEVIRRVLIELQMIC
ncbi:MAG: hydrogenase maturation protease [Acidobacteriota bacterium]|nr:hydrogenase maturation protease [Acidobacteriota bacterium]